MRVPAEYSALLLEMATLANHNQQKLMRLKPKERLAEVERMVESADVAFGVWPDPEEPHSVGMLCVKGEHLVMAAGERGVPTQMVMNAILCIEEAQAIALKQHMDRPQ